MADSISFIGAIFPLEICEGASAPLVFSDMADEDGAAITTITAARLRFFTGTIAGNSTTALVISPTLTIIGGATVEGELTPTQTRLFDPNPDLDYCFDFQVDTADGRVFAVCRGPVFVAKEMPS